MLKVFTNARIVFDVTLASFGSAALGRRGGVLFGFVAGGASLSVSELTSEDSELVLSSILEDVAPSLIGSVDEAIAVSEDMAAKKKSVKNKAGVRSDAVIRWRRRRPRAGPNIDELKTWV